MDAAAKIERIPVSKHQSRDIIGSVGCASRGALVREVSPAKEMAESAAKKCQSERKPPAEGTQ